MIHKLTVRKSRHPWSDPVLFPRLLPQLRDEGTESRLRLLPHDALFSSALESRPFISFHTDFCPKDVGKNYRSMLRSTRLLRAPHQPQSSELGPPSNEAAKANGVARQRTELKVNLLDAQKKTAECDTMKQELVTMKAELNAMRAVQHCKPCPPGFDEDTFAFFVRQLKKDEDRFDEDVRNKEKRIYTQQDDLRDKERRIDDLQKAIGDELQRTSAQPADNSKAGSWYGEILGLMKAPFADPQAAFDVLSPHRRSSHRDPVELSNVKWFNDLAIIERVTTGVELLMDGFGVAVDKSTSPLMCVLGAAGQGKTDTLRQIQRNRVVQSKILKTINSHKNWKYLPPHTASDSSPPENDIKTPRERGMTCKHVVPIFASFHQDSTYASAFEPKVESALCNRLLSEYLQLAAFDVKLSPRFDNITMSELTEFIRQHEASKRGCLSDEICIVVLIDEVRRVVDGVERVPGEVLDSSDRMTALLNAVGSAQQRALKDSALTFAVVTSLDVNGIHESVTRMSKRSLHSIPLIPCSSANIDELIKMWIDNAVNKGVMGKVSEQDMHSLLLWPAHATGGHFRSLKELWEFFQKNGTAPSPGSRQAVTAAYVLDVIARQLSSPSLHMKETDKIGSDFLQTKSESQTLYNVAMSNEHGVFYRDMNAEKGTVSPCVASRGLSDRLPFEGDTVVAQNVVSLWADVFIKLSAPKEVVMKGWETAMPLLEVIAATLIREVNGSKPVALEDVWRGVFVRHWKDAKDVTLFYKASCSDCNNVWREGAAKPTIVNDDDALRKACTSEVATLCMAKTSNYEAIEGVHTFLEMKSGAKIHSVPVVMQMKTTKKLSGPGLCGWAKDAHECAKGRLKQERDLYYVVLYCSSSFGGEGDRWPSDIPEGTIIIERKALGNLLKPFGMTPLLQTMTLI
ncbi:Hypothetical protein, putative [Bodo saltans]|uniref:Uncharacterized protein n=1 Tax=Bodo saltans TaxID=75058 RepID=A0A0S4IQK4_BODSA|nr:Hypothetical protein, putative [Bodo saltans]|eukprot:CUF28581.1 Hypothetical protein, putative [Bodo saltans]